MFVYEFLKELDSKRIVDTMCNFPSFFDMIDWDNNIDEEEKTIRKNFIKEKYLEILEDIKSKKYKNDTKNVIIVSENFPNENNEPIYEVASLPLEKVNLGETLEEFKNPMLDIIFTERNKVLGRYISKSSIKKYGEYIVAATILKTITFFGIDEEYSSNKQEEEIQNLEKILKDLEENPNQKTYSEEELWEELGIEKEEKTPEEEKEYEEKIHKEIENYINNKKFIINKTLKEFGI